MSLAIGTFISIANTHNFQNFFYDDTVPYAGTDYTFGHFGYSGSTVDLQAGNIAAQLVFSTSELMLGIAKTAADLRQIVQVKTVWLDPETFVPSSTYMDDIFMITGFEHDNSRLALRLSSPLDAITADVPQRRLTERLVGALPSTGQIQLI